MPKQLLLTATLLLALVGCSKPPAQDKTSVQKALVDYLAGRSGISVDSMDIEVTSVTFRGNEADAQVTFKAKGSTDASNLMQMKYVLEQKDGKWTVKGRSGMSDHGGPGQAAPGQAAPQGGMPAMPPGHPPTTPDSAEKAGEKK
ncbi:MAG: hypothetical protein JNK48_19960 [Bryobacterales bacterium]|nr:hypothetical protein [Bryobacterales bacterium]